MKGVGSYLKLWLQAYLHGHLVIKSFNDTYMAKRGITTEGKLQQVHLFRLAFFPLYIL